MRKINYFTKRNRTKLKICRICDKSSNCVGNFAKWVLSAISLEAFRIKLVKKRRYYSAILAFSAIKGPCIHFISPIHTFVNIPALQLENIIRFLIRAKSVNRGYYIPDIAFPPLIST